MRRPDTTTSIAIGLGALFLIFLIWTFAGSRSGNEDALGENTSAAEAREDGAKRCASPRTYDLIKRELFRRAAEVRGSDAQAFGQLAAYASVRMERPVMENENEETGAVSCSGALSLDLPPGVAVVGGRRTLAADVDYGLQPAADGTGEVLTLTNAEAIITPLATLARVGTQPGLPDIPATAIEDAQPIPPSGVGPGNPPADPDDAASEAPPATAPTASARPSFDCGNARTASERAVCASPGLAALDRDMAGQFNQAVRLADGEERALLEQTRTRFLRYRESCRSDGCIASAYRGRMNEISDIMAGRWSPPR